MTKPAPNFTPGSFESLVAELESAAIMHGTHTVPTIGDVPGTLERLEKAREALLAYGHACHEAATESALRDFIQVEKRLCALLGRQWSASGISVDSLLTQIEACEEAWRAESAPLTEEHILRCMALPLGCETWTQTERAVFMARGLERAHGIGSKG